jgi:glycosyltransferase involved in cell wall biosynthesis
MLTLDTLRVAIVADLLEEGWPSMDLVADMLMAHVGADGVTPRLIRPDFTTPAGAPGSVQPATPPTIQRIAHRFWSYPRWLRQQAAADVYHIVDHSYAHLAHELPAGRVVVTCHDTDAFRALMYPGERSSGLPRWLVKRVLGGLRLAAQVVCDTEATRAELVGNGLVAMERTMVLGMGTHPECSPVPRADADAAAAALTGATGRADLLHVGSTIPRKRIDVLLETVAIAARRRPDVRLWRVGGAFTAEQSRLARDLGIDDRIVVLPFVSRAVLAALYRRAALVLLPSQREGFGLPVIESMACGTPILCSDLPVLREVGGDAAEYCTVGAPSTWAARVGALLAEREDQPARWRARQASGLARAAAFSWQRYAAGMQGVYQRVAAVSVR